jgi:uncharacterized LabA/DUF88 family protein
MNRVVFLVDGFNLNHSLVEAQRDAKGATTKWLDLAKLCRSFLPVAGRLTQQRAQLERVHYFTAVPTHRSEDKVRRHALYAQCLRSSGVVVNLGRFKRKSVFCRTCRGYSDAYEEKETDVAIAVKLLEVCLADEGETVVLMTGDTDLSPAVVTCKRLFPDKLVLFAFPYRRTNQELAKIAPESFSIKLRSIRRCQFPDPLTLKDGAMVRKPDSW